MKLFVVALLLTGQALSQSEPKRKDPALTAEISALVALQAESRAVLYEILNKCVLANECENVGELAEREESLANQIHDLAEKIEHESQGVNHADVQRPR